ncbi:MAG: polyprenyl diphosphate synthase [Lentisphaeria bacterium]|nr:polyprenyl diphosphate synthase [Lentisphaeria bacterium]
MKNEPRIPRHIAIIMDGNGRWATQHNLPRADGHRAGAQRVHDLVEFLEYSQVEYLTLYAFSTENWKRSPLEVAALMNLLGEFLDNNLEKLMRHHVRLKMIGQLERLPQNVAKKLCSAIELTRENKSGTLTLALSYGGRAEICQAAKRLALAVKRGEVPEQDIDEAAFAKFLYEPELPEVDLLIRTSGEMRISNFMLWQLAYSEIYVTDILWPDFTPAELEKAMTWFSMRERRFGGR